MGWNCHVWRRVRKNFIINTIYIFFIRKVVVVVEGKIAGIKNYTVLSKSCFNHPAPSFKNYG